MGHLAGGKIGLAIGREARAQGATFFGGVYVNLPRHPAWGRVQQMYGEGPILLGEMGAALTRGMQKNAMVCVKHFALNSMENARFRVDARVDEATLHEVFLALEVARRSMVLLQNNPVRGRQLLPLNPNALSKLAVVGRLAKTRNTGDHGSSDVRSPQVASPYKGLKAAFPLHIVALADSGDVSEMAQAAFGADAAVVVVGYNAEDEG